MKKRMKKIIAVLLAGAMTAGLAACGGGQDGDSTDKSSDGKTTIKIAWWGGESRHEYTQKLMDAYMEENPDIEFEATPSGWEGYFEKLSTQASSGSMPDLVQMDYQYISTYAKNNSLADLQEFIDDGTLDMSNVDDATIESGRIDGKTVGIVTGTNTLAVIYNPDVLQQAGLEAPADDWTWDDYIEMNTKVTEMTGKPSALTATIGAFGDMNYFNYWVRQHGETLFNEDGTGLGFEDDSITADYFQMWKDLSDGNVAPDPDEQTQIETLGIESLPVVTGEAATTIEWNTYPTKVMSSNDNLKLAFMPGATENNAMWMKPAMFWSVSETSKVKEECAKFIDWMQNSEEANDIIMADKGVPISSEIRDYMVNSGKLTQTQIEMFEYADKATEIAGECPAPEPSGISEVNEAFKNAGTSVQYGQTTPEEAAVSFREQVTDILERNNG